MIEFKKNIEVDSGSNRNFGIVFSIVFLIIGIYPLGYGEDIQLWAMGVAIIFFLLSYLAPNILNYPNRIWFKLGLLLGAIVGPVIMTFVYVITVLPIGLTMRIIGKDLLKLKIDKKVKSYWIERGESVSTMKNQF